MKTGSNFAAALLLAAAAALAPAASFGAPVLSVQLSNASVNVGDIVTASIRITNAVDLYAFEFEFSFSAGSVSALSAAEGTFFNSAGPSLFLPGVFDNSGGNIGLTAGSLLGPIAGADGDGILAEFVFSAQSVGAVTFTLTSVTLLDSNLGIAVPAVSGATLQISGGPQPMPEPGSLLLVAPVLAWLVRRGATG